MLLLLLNCSLDSSNNGRIFSKCISKYFVELILIKAIFFILNILNQKLFFTDSRQPNAHKKENQQKGAKMLLPWILITWIVLVFNLGVGILFGLDIQYPFKVDILIYLTAYGDQIYYIRWLMCFN